MFWLWQSPGQTAERIVQYKIIIRRVYFIKYTYRNSQNINFACYFVWVWKLVTHVWRTTYDQGVENRVLRGISGS